jgi:hypothetical protein
MKKILMFALILMVAIGVSGFTRSVKSVSPETIIEEVTNASSGTVYGVIESTPQEYVINTPIGVYSVEKTSDGFSCMGVTAKVSLKGKGRYAINSSIGDFIVDTRKCTITKY